MNNIDNIFLRLIIFGFSVILSAWVISLISSIMKNLNEGTKKVLKTLNTSRIEIYPLDGDMESLSKESIVNICKEIVTDQVCRALYETEKVTVLESNNLVDGSVLVIFRYRMHDKENINGSTRDRLVSSIHTVKLTLNKLAQSVHIENVMSVDSDSVSHLNDPKGFIRDSLTPFTGPCSKEINTSVVKQMISD